MTKTPLITADELEIVQELYSVGKTDEGFTVLLDEHVDSRRWVEVYYRVFTNPQGEYLAYYYEVPSTEYQEGSEAEVTPSDVFRVEPREKVIIEYVKVKD